MCRYCARPAWLRDSEGPVHRCCLAWARVIAAGYPCPACQIALHLERTGRLPDEPPWIPRTLPDGSPVVPDPVSGLVPLRETRPTRCVDGGPDDRDGA